MTTLTHIQTNRFLVNGVSFDPPTVPILLQILSGAQNAWDLVPSGSIYALEPNKSVELTIPGVSSGVVSIRTSAIVGRFADIIDQAPGSPTWARFPCSPERRERVLQLC